MVALLWADGHVNAALELEGLWNDLAKVLTFSLVCAYREETVTGSRHVDAFREISCLHTAVVGHRPRDGREGGLRREFDATRGFSRSSTAPGEARRFVVEALQAHEWDEFVDDAALVVAELASNAVSHAQSNFTVSVAGSVAVCPYLGSRCRCVSARASRGDDVNAIRSRVEHRQGLDR